MKQSNEVSCILYDGNRPPRYFKFKKRFIHLFFYGLPFATFLSLLILVATAIYFKQIQRLSQKRVPEITNLLQKEKTELTNSLEKLKQEKLQLIQKMNEPIQEVSKLSLFKDSLGRKDLSSSPELDINTLKIKTDGETKKFSFNIVNQTENQVRLSGYIFVILKTTNQVHICISKEIASYACTNF